MTFGKWQQDMAVKMEDMLSVKQDLRNIMMLLQGGNMPVPHPTILPGNEKQGLIVTQSQHPDPPPRGPGMI